MHIFYFVTCKVNIFMSVPKIYFYIYTTRVLIGLHCDLDIIFDENNVFRKDMSCVNNIYILTSIAKIKWIINYLLSVLLLI